MRRDRANTILWKKKREISEDIWHRKPRKTKKFSCIPIHLKQVPNIQDQISWAISNWRSSYNRNQEFQNEKRILRKKFFSTEKINADLVGWGRQSRQAPCFEEREQEMSMHWISLKTPMNIQKWMRSNTQSLNY